MLFFYNFNPLNYIHCIIFQICNSFQKLLMVKLGPLSLV